MSSKALRVVYIGKEATPGDGATVDVALRARATLEAVPTKQMIEEDIGSLAPPRSVISALKATGQLEAEAYYQHLPYFLSLALGAGSVVTTGDPEVWTFDLPGATAPIFATYNVEAGDGADHIVRASDVFSPSMEIKGTAAGLWVITNPLVGGSVTYPAAHGATPTLPASPAALRLAETTIAIDDLYADIGDTVMEELISFSWKIDKLQHQKQFGGSLYPSGRGNAKYEVTLEVVTEVEQAVFESEKAKLLTNATSAIRIRNFMDEAGGTGIDWYCNLDGSYVLHQVGVLDDRDGNNTIKLVYKLETDSLGNIGSIAVGCDLQAL